MTQQIESFRLSSGLSVVVERMPDLQSAAMTLMIPAGSVYDQVSKQGTAAILAEMLPRGAGGLSPREYCSQLDNLGLQRNISGGTGHLTISAATTADRLCDAIPEVAKMVCSPHLDDAEFDPARDMIEQGLMAMEDEPRQQLGRELRRYSYAAPWGNPSEGTREDLPNISNSDVREHFSRFVRPNKSILGIAGNVSPDQIRRVLEESFSGWGPGEEFEVVAGARPESPFHITHDSTQTHIGLSWESVPYNHDRYFEAWAAVSLLSGGMSSRLFTEVREKRGLCYAISASLSTLKDEGRVFAYAGTTTERAQETLDVTMSEVHRLHEGITDEELDRCKARAKSSLVMQQESTMSRASSMARDIYHMGRVVTLDEIRRRINELTVERVRQFVLDYSPKSTVLVTLGPKPLSLPCT
ncbi:MAG: insulinase family protein [Planctomycetaceae bacterium]|nr:insulinase family protein [Planctomycetaceae bacterium]